jgi:hypothetical protein
MTGVEINRDILDLVNRRFGEFTGHLDRHPRVTFVNDEARSFIARMRDTRSSKSASRSAKLRFSEFTVSTGAAL